MCVCVCVCVVPQPFAPATAANPNLGPATYDVKSFVAERQMYDFHAPRTPSPPPPRGTDSSKDNRRAFVLPRDTTPVFVSETPHPVFADTQKRSDVTVRQTERHGCGTV